MTLISPLAAPLAAAGAAPAGRAPAHAFAGRNVANIKAHNLQAVLLTLLHQGPLSRARIAELTGLSTTTITNLMAELLGQGIVAEEGHEPYAHQGAGRPRIRVSLVPSARYVVGIHFDVDNVRVAVADLAGQLGHCHTAPQQGPAESVLERAASLVEEALAEAGIPRERVLGVGAGASGLVDPDSGVNLLSPSLGWRDVPVRDILAGRLGLPVVVENNVRVMALAESMFGVGRSVRSLAFVYARVGVGAGLIVGGQVFRGSFGGAGEIGHATVLPAGGEVCRCGNRGCLETVVSEPAILARAGRLAEEKPDSLLARTMRPAPGARPGIEQVFSAARGGDEGAAGLLRECARYMGTALANLVNIVNPEMIILGGLLAAGQDLLLPEIETTLRERAFGGMGRRVDLRVATFGANSGVLGAGALALDGLFYRQSVPALNASGVSVAAAVAA